MMYKVVRFACTTLLLATTSAMAADIVDTAIANGSFNTLTAALTKANLVETLKGTGPFTVFAPTDAAFQTLLTTLGITSEELLNRADLGDILKYHVSSGKALSSGLKDGQKVASLQAKPNLAKELTVSINGTTVKINDATVTTADLDCDNGVIHVIDKVLLPPKVNVVQTAVAAGTFTTLAAALTKANLIDTLSGEGPFTVFAPTDAAFEAALKALGITAEELLARADLGDILTFHVSSGKAMSSGLKDGQKVTSLQAKPNLAKELTVSISGTTVKINDATVTTADLDCSNGVIHVIDKVLLPPKVNVVQTAVAAGTFTTLAAALTKANLVDALSGEGPFTVFAPTDKAFEAAMKALELTETQLLGLGDLGDILKFHVHSGKAMSSGLSDGMKVSTLQGTELTVTISGKTVKVNDATVTSADLETSNGVIHVIDAVLLPAAPKSSTAAPKADDKKTEKTKDLSAAASYHQRGFGILSLFGILSVIVSN